MFDKMKEFTLKVVSNKAFRGVLYVAAGVAVVYYSAKYGTKGIAILRKQIKRFDNEKLTKYKEKYTKEVKELLATITDAVESFAHEKKAYKK